MAYSLLSPAEVLAKLCKYAGPKEYVIGYNPSSSKHLDLIRLNINSSTPHPKPVVSCCRVDKGKGVEIAVLKNNKRKEELADKVEEFLEENDTDFSSMRTETTYISFYLPATQSLAYIFDGGEGTITILSDEEAFLESLEDLAEKGIRN